MAEYIEREALLKKAIEEKRFVFRIEDLLNGEVIFKTVYKDLADFIMSAPAADVAPVVHGRWERIGIRGRKGLPIYPCCSACGIVSAAYRSEWEGLRGAWNYCPNCGAKMDGGNAP